MATVELDPMCRQCRELVQQARGVLIQECTYSNEEAYRYLYEIAQARKVPIAEVAGHVVAGETAWLRIQPLCPTVR